MLKKVSLCILTTFFSAVAYAVVINGPLEKARLESLTRSPTCVNGRIYYNITSHSMQLCSNGEWSTPTALGYTPESTDNKSLETDLGGDSPSNEYFPSQAAVKTFIDNGFSTAEVKLNGATSGSITLKTDAVIGTPYTVTLPATGPSVTWAGWSTAQALTYNKSGYGWSNVSVNPKTPTVQKFTSGSGTYTTPTGARYIRVRMVGGGGGGGGGLGTDGTNGGSTVFGSSVIVATGGYAGLTNGYGGVGGSAYFDSSINGIAVTGADGQSGQQISDDTAAYWSGGIGGNSFFGGAGSRWSAYGGPLAVTNSGSGGGGGYAIGSGSSGSYSGGGGGSGGYIDAILSEPAASYAYSVGSSGIAGSAGALSGAGGHGGSGVLIVEEYYQ
jgi:hypothetical protein